MEWCTTHSCMQLFTHSTKCYRIIHFCIGECVECTHIAHCEQQKWILLLCCFSLSPYAVEFLQLNFFCCSSYFSTPILRVCCRPANANLHNSMKPHTVYTQQTCELQRVCSLFCVKSHFAISWSFQSISMNYWCRILCFCALIWKYCVYMFFDQYQCGSVLVRFIKNILVFAEIHMQKCSTRTSISEFNNSKKCH